MKIIHFELTSNGEHIGSTPIREQAVAAAKAHANRNSVDVDVIATLEDGNTRKIIVKPDGSVDKVWQRSYIDPIPGVIYRPATFKPTFHKYAGEICNGIQMHVTDYRHAELFRAGLHILDAVRELFPEKLEWREEGLGVDRLLGTDEYRLGMSTDELIAAHAQKRAAFTEKVRRHLLY